MPTVLIVLVMAACILIPWCIIINPQIFKLVNRLPELYASRALEEYVVGKSDKSEGHLRLGELESLIADPEQESESAAHLVQLAKLTSRRPKQLARACRIIPLLAIDYSFEPPLLASLGKPSIEKSLQADDRSRRLEAFIIFI